MTKRKKRDLIPIIIKKRTISNFHTNASNAKKLSMMHLLRLSIESRQKLKKIFKQNKINDSILINYCYKFVK